MLHHSLQHNAVNVTTETALHLVENLKRILLETVCSMESISVMKISTVLDPRFKTMAFLSASKAKDAVKRLKSECAAEMRNTVPAQMEDAQAGPSTQPSVQMTTCGSCWTWKKRRAKPIQMSPAMP